MNRRPFFSARMAPFCRRRLSSVLMVDSCQLRCCASAAVTSSAVAEPRSHSTARTTDSASLIDSGAFIDTASLHAGGHLGDAGLVRYPIHFPSLAPVFREGLLEVRRLRVGARPLEPLEDIAAIIGVPAVEVSYSILELTYIGRAADRSYRGRRPVETPLPALRVVQAQRQPVDGAVRALDVEFLDLRTAAPQRARPRRPVVLHPVVGARERMEQFLQMNVPVTQLEVEVMGAIVGGGRRAGRWARGGRRQTATGHEERAQEQCCPGELRRRHCIPRFDYVCRHLETTRVNIDVKTHRRATGAAA